MKSIKELASAIITWIDDNDYEACSISIGHDRNDFNRALAEDLTRAWQEAKSWVRPEGGFVFKQVNWPFTTASWLAQANELKKDQPDALVIISSIPSSIEVLKRLADQRNWSAKKTFCLFYYSKKLQKHNADLAIYEGLNLDLGRKKMGANQWRNAICFLKG